MNEELKAYVNAYMDGLEVEYRFTVKWFNVTSLSDFDKICNEYRIKPKAEDKWQRVIDERTLIEDMLWFIEDLMPYTPEYFAEKWRHQEQYEDLKRRMGDKDE